MTPTGAQVPASGTELAIAAEGLIELIQVTLAEGKSIRFKVAARGSSMAPWIRHGDVITLSPLSRRGARIGDVVAYLQPGIGRMIVHRIVNFREGSPVLRGDNCTGNDETIVGFSILGRVTSVRRNGILLPGVGPEGRLLALLSVLGLLRLIWRPIPWIRKLLSRKERQT